MLLYANNVHTQPFSRESSACREVIKDGHLALVWSASLIASHETLEGVNGKCGIQTDWAQGCHDQKSLYNLSGLPASVGAGQCTFLFYKSRSRGASKG